MSIDPFLSRVERSTGADAALVPLLRSERGTTMVLDLSAAWLIPRGRSDVKEFGYRLWPVRSFQSVQARKSNKYIPAVVCAERE